jgi:hypothetical protein
MLRRSSCQHLSTPLALKEAPFVAGDRHLTKPADLSSLEAVLDQPIEPSTFALRMLQPKRK